MNQLESILEAHPLKNDFDIRVIKHRAGRITLRLLKTNAMPTILLGTLGNILDCAARVAGYTLFGECTVSECEITIHTLLTKEIVVSTNTSDSNQQIATFQCEIHGLIQRSRILIAESHGTLIKMRTKLPVVA